jgi:HD-like signal output (HDOD) protein
LIFASHSPKLYRQVIDIAAKENKPVYEIEWELFGAIHSEIGAYLLGQWGLPEVVVELIAYHHSNDIPDYLSIELSALKAADVYSREILPTSDLGISDTSDKIFSSSPYLKTKKKEWYSVCIDAMSKSSIKI